MLSRRTFLAASAATAVATSHLARAQTAGRLRVALATPPAGLDPQFQNSTPSSQIAASMFNALTAFDEGQNLGPELATSWRLVSPTTWEFTLRPGVLFSDGAPLTAEDVAASFARVPTVQSSNPFTAYTRTVDRIEAPTHGKVLIHTRMPDPLLPASATRIRIIPARFSKSPSSDFNRGEATVGSGPYVLKEHIIGTRIVLARNERYWGERQPWDEIVITFIAEKGARSAALLAGDVDLIDAVAPSDVGRLRTVPHIKIVSAISNRLIYFSPDTRRDVSPFITAFDGKPLTVNPLKDLRVRQALSLAINREGIASRIMGGEARPAAQFLPRDDGFGADPTLKPTPYEPERAKALLSEAGYPRGFRLTLHSCNDRYQNDSEVAQAVAQMFSRIGVPTQAEVMPWSVYSKRSIELDFSFCLGSWGANTGEAGTPLLATVATRSRSAGTGNYGGYSNAALDALLAEALSTMDDTRRAEMLARASRMAVGDVAVIPMHFELSSWGTSARVNFTGRSDQYTLMTNAAPVR